MARGGREAAVGETGTDAAGRRRTPVALTIAGADSGGGAGIQADLKAFARCGVHGTSAITAITAQNTLGVTAIHQVPPEIVLAQVRAVLADIGADAVKVGMLGSAQITLAVAHALDELPAGTPVVVDPVMVAESGARLLDEDAQGALIAEIVPRASVLTPNLPEARVLAGLPPRASGARTGPGEGQGKDEEEEEARELARAVLALGPGAVVLTGGHRGRAVDLLLERSPSDRWGEPSVRRGGASRRGSEANDRASDPQIVEIPGERHRDGAAHGSGCTHSAVLTARLALGDTTLQAARVARSLAGEAIAKGLRDVGAGAGPVDVLGLERMRGS
ncbi:MAG TPA: bifunctional hydroxymethylpyrimidine kinase/phosphomethylpyrimidine kinase [Solirubrobacteraceae bacterium]|jgi:hydroxymethylpyrimidine/phosphomethylpyrimidine kinase|nr:bifunctional hydroxymethylpyrimidine kinase/phosphomethylpyrimidine kinase [Solirubrobacteraceae bacterium]